MATINKIKPVNRQIVTIDANNKPLGRLAAEVSVLLRGKGKPTFLPYIDSGDTVVVKNIDRMIFTGRKLEDKKYFQYTGYIGNLKEKSLKEFLAKSGPKEVLRKAVMGMLAKNKLRAKQIKRLKFE
jgi:large subunit ribosomal protein L13